MKKIFFIVTIVCIALSINAQIQIDNSDIQFQVEKLSHEMKQIKSENERRNKELHRTIDSQKILIDSLILIVNSNSTKIDDVSKTVDQNMNITKKELSTANDRLTSSINEKSLITGIVGGLAIIIAIVSFIYFKKETNQHLDSFSSFDKKIKDLNIEQIRLKDGILDNSLKYLDAIEETIGKILNKEKEEKHEVIDHSLAIAVANEMARIQQNLNHMDPTVKGVSQLKNRSKAIITTLNSKQYDILLWSNRN